MRGLRGTGRPVSQHDGLFFSLNEECAMFQKGLGRDKIVEIHVRCVADQLLEAVERADIRSISPRSPMQVSVLASIMAISGDGFMFAGCIPRQSY